MTRQLFSPPHVEASPEVRWLLARAFGPVGAPAAAAGDPEVVVRLASAYRLVQRVVARTETSVLAAELGQRTAMRLVSKQGLGQARSEALARSVPLVAAAAAAAPTPVALLKFAALMATGVVTAATRRASDIDVLVREKAVAAFVVGLRERGFEPAADADPAPRGHLPALADAAGEARVEVHTSLLGIVGGQPGRPATLDSLIRDGALTSAPGLPAGCLVPAREVMVAHALVHGLVQHGFSPHSYPPFKMIADLIDLGLGAADGAELAAAACRWFPDGRWSIDVGAVHSLCRALAQGDLSVLEPKRREWPERRLLDHCLAGPVDTSYRRRLKLRRVLFVGALRGRVRTVGRALRSAVYISRREIDRHYGPPRTELGYLGYRCLWPFDVLFRKLPSAAAGLLRRGAR